MSKFTKIFAGTPGTDSYSNIVSDVYQDNFDEGIFTGKGIYNVEVFSKVLMGEIPENTVLSHDLLEGSYLRCGFATDIMVMDGYPTNYISYKKRLHRWIRGDYQISKWLGSTLNFNGKEKINPLNELSKFKILDNLLRELLPISVLISLFLYFILKIFSNIKFGAQAVIALLSLLFPIVLSIVNKVVYKKDGEIQGKSFYHGISGIRLSVYKCLINLSILPDMAYMHADAIIRSLYRMNVSGEKMLEWTTSAETEKNSNISILAYYKNMFFNIVMAVIVAILGIIALKFQMLYLAVVLFGLAILWSVTPSVMWDLSQKLVNEKAINLIDSKDKEYLKEIAKDTWKFFKDNLNEENNYLPPDNYQDDRKIKLVDRTSSTNIGLALLAVVSANDLNYEDKSSTVVLINKMLDVIGSLQKWYGHLYNWYNIRTLQPLEPKYVSTVDSGNFVGYLYVVKEWAYENELKDIYNKCSKLIDDTDFSKLFDTDKKIFSIGFDVEKNELTDSYYDLLASEARQASFIAIAKKDVDVKHWSKLSRTLTTLNKYKGLVSWSGTSFEYLMPNVNMPKYEGTLLDETCKFMVMSQRLYAKKLDIPWGISESAFNLKDLYNNYQYKAFGIPWLGLKRGLSDDMVVSSYGSILAIMDFPVEVIENLKVLKKYGMQGKYGFYESIDFTPSRLDKNSEYSVVKTYMAHHQGLILLSLNNLFNDNILQKRFMGNPEIEAVDILLQERMPENIIVTKERKEKVEKSKNALNMGSYSIERDKVNNDLNIAGIVANENYSIIVDQKGNGYSKFKNIRVNRFKRTDYEEQGIFFAIKDVSMGKVWYNTEKNIGKKSDKYHVNIAPDSIKFSRTDGYITTNTKITVDSNDALEIRALEIYNNSNEDKIFEVTSYFEPILSTANQDDAHKAFNNLFLKFDFEDNILWVKRKDIYMGVTLYSFDEDGRLEFETDKEKFIGRNNFEIPEYIKNSSQFENNASLAPNPIVAVKRTFEIKANNKSELCLLISIADSKEKARKILLEKLTKENVNRCFELSRVRIEAENRYLAVKGEDAILYNKILTYMVFGNPLKKIRYKKNNAHIQHLQSDLWKYGVSGDLPILTVRIDEVNNIHIVEQAIKAFEYLKRKNINMDLVILNTEDERHGMYVEEEVLKIINSRNIDYLKNISGGIFLVKAKEKEIFEICSDVFLDSDKGKISKQLEDIEEEYVKSLPSINRDEISSNINISEVSEEVYTDMQKLIYYNDIGGFSEDGKEYIIRINNNQKTPLVWSHLMANENFGTVVTESGGGYTWKKNSRLNRITAWSNDPVEDPPSEGIYVRDDAKNKTWSVCASPKSDGNNYYIKYGFGYATYIHNSSEIVENLNVFVAQSENVKVNLLNIKNRTQTTKKLRLVYFVKPAMGEDEKYLNSFMNLKYDEKNNMIIGKAAYSREKTENMYISSSEKIVSYTGCKRDVLGNNSMFNISNSKFNNENSLGQNEIIALQIEVELQPYENKDISFIIGAEEEEAICAEKSKKYGEIQNCVNEFDSVKKYWNNKLNMLQVETPIKSLDFMLNGWLMYQTIVSRLLSRTAYYQSGGAIGFRDQLQDSLSMKYVNPEMLKNQIVKHARHQFIEGDVEHWWHEGYNKGIRTKFSDDLLWLPYAVSEYIKVTGDFSILDIKASYKDGMILNENEDERYDTYTDGNIVENIFEHCIRAIEKGINIGKNGLPKIGTGDWNDGFSSVGRKGIGESVWLGFFLYDVLRKFDFILEYKQEFVKQERYKKIMHDLKSALNSNGWDGRWFRRAFTDNGDILGSIQNDECRIDGISQSWSVISNAGDNDKKYIAMSSLENYLVDKENGLIKLLDPPFEHGNLNPGYIQNYLPGTRENGGQYTHGAVWAIIAETLLGNAEKAMELYKMINPIEHSKTYELMQKYKVEPYVICADIYGKGNLAGRGGWTWYTGSSSWYFNAGIEYILGMKIENGNITIKPSIPKEWKEYKIKYNYKDTIYNITVRNFSEKNTVDDSSKIYLNNKEQISKQIPLEENSRRKKYYD